MRVKIILAFDGSKYLGFQIQKAKHQTVAKALYSALNSLHITNKITSSGRTDKNVHATNQVIHIDLPSFWTNCDKLREHLNYKLPNSIKIKFIKKTNEDFHARFCAKKRSYRYLLSTKAIDPFCNSYISYINLVNLPLMEKALKLFIGKHDFKYFQKSTKNSGTTIREIFSAKIYIYKDLYIIKIVANGFLRSQIRMMIFSILAVSNKKITLKQLQSQIDAKKRYVNGLSLANGLYLTHIKY